MLAHLLMALPLEHPQRKSRLFKKRIKSSSIELPTFSGPSTRRKEVPVLQAAPLSCSQPIPILMRLDSASLWLPSLASPSRSSKSTLTPRKPRAPTPQACSPAFRLTLELLVVSSQFANICVENQTNCSAVTPKRPPRSTSGATGLPPLWLLSAPKFSKECMVPTSLVFRFSRPTGLKLPRTLKPRSREQTPLENSWLGANSRLLT